MRGSCGICFTCIRTSPCTHIYIYIYIYVAVPSSIILYSSIIYHVGHALMLMHWLKTYVSSTRLSYSRGLFKAVILVNVYTDAVLSSAFADVFKHFLHILGLRGYPQSLWGYPFGFSMPKRCVFDETLASQGGLGAVPGPSLGLFF